MCGIAGIVSLANERTVDAGLIERMNDRITHRGPDSSGVWVNNGVGLGHRRLSIIDLSTVANQPLFNEDGAVAIVFNGEIYNYQSLMEDLADRGHIFRSRSDTEVIVHLYEEYGVDCLSHLRGMFAFAIWDSRQKRLFLARDRVGKKPLYYHQSGCTLVFASEIKSILECPWVKPEVNWQAIDCFFGYQYIPSPITAFAGIHKLPPAHFAVFDLIGNFGVHRYWSLEPEQQDGDFVTSKNKLKELLYEAVSLRMISDVPLGAFLSGGVDSSLIVAIMSKLSKEKVRTFSIGFEDERYNELPYAKSAAGICGTEHQEFIVRPDICGILPKLIWHYNEPFGDSSAIPTYYLSKVTRSEVKVALSGDGGDELFGGYQRYVDLWNMNHTDKFGLAFKNLDTKPRNLVQKIASSLKMRLTDSKTRNYHWISVFDYSMRKRRYSTARVNKLADDYPWNHYSGIWDSFKAGDPVMSAMLTDINLYLPDDILVKVDVASMANSLEVRVPLLDQNIVSFAASVPLSSKIGTSGNKLLLRALAAEFFPESFLDRRKKGFSIPINSWLSNELFTVCEQIVMSSIDTLGGYFDYDEIHSLLHEHRSKGNMGNQVWLLLNFVLWHALFIEQKDITDSFAALTRKG